MSGNPQRAAAQRATAAAAIAALAIVVSGCGGQSSAAPRSGTGSGRVIDVHADARGALRFRPARETASPGRVTVRFDNPSSVPHGLTLERGGFRSGGRVVGQGGRTVIHVTLKRGRYVYFCPVASHRASGMVGTITVR